MANANSKMFFACGANKKAFGQIDQPKGTKPREIRTLGVRRKVKLRLQQSRQTADKARRPRRRPTQGSARRRRWGEGMAESIDSFYSEIHIAMLCYAQL